VLESATAAELAEAIASSGIADNAQRCARSLEGAEFIEIEHIYISTPYQRQRIGTRIIGDLAANARVSRKPLR